MKNSRPTQVERIKNYLLEFGSITQLEALRDLGIMRLSARISEMKSSGENIVSKQKVILNRYGEKCYIAEYSLGGLENVK